jgi:broad specificity phosphatase PhoE
LTFTLKGCYFEGKFILLGSSKHVNRDYNPDFISRLQTEKVGELDAFVIHLLEQDVLAGDLTFLDRDYLYQGAELLDDFFVRNVGFFVHIQRQLRGPLLLVLHEAAPGYNNSILTALAHLVMGFLYS